MFRWYDVAGLTGMVHSIRNVVPSALAVPCWFRFSLPDALWVYSFTATMCYIWADRDGVWKRVWTSAGVLLGAGGEVGQAIGVVPGTFDLVDLVLCVLAGLAAAFATTRSLRRACA